MACNLQPRDQKTERGHLYPSPTKAGFPGGKLDAPSCCLRGIAARMMPEIGTRVGGGCVPNRQPKREYEIMCCVCQLFFAKENWRSRTSAAIKRYKDLTCRMKQTAREFDICPARPSHERDCVRAESSLARRGVFKRCHHVFSASWSGFIPP
jgi:hypothetical protein